MIRIEKIATKIHESVRAVYLQSGLQLKEEDIGNASIPRNDLD